MTTSFVMQAKENYDAASVAELDGGTQVGVFSLDPTNIGASYDAINGKLTYLGMILPNFTPDHGHPGSYTNATGHTLYDGALKVIAPGDTIVVPLVTSNNDTSFSPQVCQKDLVTGAVTFYPTYLASALVPAHVGFTFLSVDNKGAGYTTATLTVSGGGGSGLTGVILLDAGGGGKVVAPYITNWGTGYTSNPTFGVTGDGSGVTLQTATYRTPSDGSWRWIGANFAQSVEFPNGPNLVNPRNGDVWACAQSCELYQYRKVDDFAQIIGPALIPLSNSSFTSPTLYAAGVDATWVYALSYPLSGTAKRNNFMLVPAAIQAAETAAASKFPYVVWLTAPFADDLGARLTFDTGGNLYFLSIGDDGSGKFRWRLTKYVPPALGTFGANLPGTMTDLTASLWDTGGPNTDGANYTFAHYTGYAGSLLFALCRLPDTNQMACVLKMLRQASSAPSSYANTLFSCLYVTFGGSPAYDYHSGFVTGYMDSSWVSAGSIPTTGWAVMDCREHDNYLEQSDHVYAGVDYTKRWFVFQCYPISAGAVDTSNGLMDVFVQYQFVSGSAPTIVTPAGISAPGVLTDANFSANYPAYKTAISQQFAVYNSTLFGDMGTAGFPFNETTGLVYEDVGLSPTTTGDGSFWYSGVATNNDQGSVDGDALFYLDAAFTSRAAYNASGQPNYEYGPISPPFLRLSFAPVTPPVAGRKAKVALFYGKKPA